MTKAREETATSSKKCLKYYNSISHKAYIAAKIIVVFGICAFGVPWCIGGIVHTFNLMGWNEQGTWNNINIVVGFIGGFIGVVVGFFIESVLIRQWKNINKYAELSKLLCKKIEVYLHNENFYSYCSDGIDRYLDILNAGLAENERMERKDLMISDEKEFSACCAIVREARQIAGLGVLEFNDKYPELDESGDISDNEKFVWTVNEDVVTFPLLYNIMDSDKCEIFLDLPCGLIGDFRKIKSMLRKFICYVQRKSCDENETDFKIFESLQDLFFTVKNMNECNTDRYERILVFLLYIRFIDILKGILIVFKGSV